MSDINTHLKALENDIEQAIRSTRRRNAVTVLLALISVGLIGYWLYYAHTKFSAVDPDFAADYAQAQLTDYLPQAGADLEVSLKSYAPQFIGEAENRLNAIPDRFADEMESEMKTQTEAAAPQIEDELSKSIKTAIEQASTSAKGSDDVARFKSMLDALSIVYRDESMHLVDQVHDMYAKQGSDILAYIQLLSANKNLDRRQQLHREMLQSFLLVAQQHSASTAQ
jgi:hypothetical protein